MTRTVRNRNNNKRTYAEKMHKSVLACRKSHNIVPGKNTLKNLASILTLGFSDTLIRFLFCYFRRHMIKSVGEGH